MEIDPSESPIDLTSASDWDVAMRFHELKSHQNFKNLASQLRKISASAVLRQAQSVLGSVVRPSLKNKTTLDQISADQIQELELDEILEESPLALTGSVALRAEDVWIQYSDRPVYPIFICVDTSLSMTGEKLALTAVALAVVLLEFSEDPVGIVAFENRGTVLKRPEEKITVHQLVERFLDVPAQGYTHLEDGLRKSLRQHQGLRRVAEHQRKSTAILLTDGKYTAGKDPAYLASRFERLEVIKMGKERSSLELCRELARRGGGGLHEVGDLSALPKTMYHLVKELLRG